MDLKSLRNTVKKLRYVLVFLIVIGFSFGAWNLLFSKDNYIPASFTDARRASAIIGEQIVGLSSASSDQIKEIQKLEQNKKYSDALDAVMAEKKRVADMRDQGSKLLTGLSAMTQSVSEIKPEAARTAALQAINYETGIVNHLLAYNELLEALLQLMTARILYGVNTTANFNDTIIKINGEISAINDLNSKFTEAISGLK
ncbi:MAG: hypothetical protein Q8P97_02095 [bacterium]|nr:hypothetical protein [bacterium]